MPISESLIPKDARRITLSVIIMVLDSFEGALDSPSLMTSMMCRLSRIGLSDNRLLAINNIVVAATRLPIMKEKRIPKGPEPIDSRINAVKNLALVATISKTSTLFAFEIPSSAKRPTKPIGERTSIAIATHKYPLRDA
jgi:hypothetical protein